MNSKIKKIIIATGGTGGHVFPAYSLAKHFLGKKINVEILNYMPNFIFISKFK